MVFCRCSLFMSPLSSAHFMPCEDSLKTVSCKVSHMVFEGLLPCSAHTTYPAAFHQVEGCTPLDWHWMRIAQSCAISNIESQW